MGGKGKCLRCEVCAWSTVGARGRNVKYTMHRLYMKRKGKFVKVGWVCLACGSVVLDGIKPWSSRVAEPKIQIK